MIDYTFKNPSPFALRGNGSQSHSAQRCVSTRAVLDDAAIRGSEWYRLTNAGDLMH